MTGPDRPWQRLHAAITAWMATVKDRHGDLLRVDPGYGRDLAAGIAAIAKVLVAHPAVTAAIAALASQLLKAPARTRPLPPASRSQRSPRLWDRDDWEADDDQHWDDQRWDDE